MKINILIILGISLLICGCKPSEAAIQTPVAQTLTAWPSQTPYPTYTPFIQTKIVTLTFTPGPTSTPTPSPTPTKTPTPFNINACVPLIVNINTSSPPEQDQEEYLRYDGLCVKVFYDPSFTGGGEYTADFKWSIQAILLKDEQTPPNVNKPTQFSIVWGIFKVVGEELFIHLRRVDVLPKNQVPVHNGMYIIGVNSDMYPGTWKSNLSATDTDSCYWERTNPTTGNIIDNHFGIGGMSVRVYEGELFQTDDCGIWFFVNP